MTDSPRFAALIGWPAAHSLSSLLHGYWLKEHGISGAYVQLSVPPQDFGKCVSALRRLRFAGANVTVPHKQQAFSLAETLDDDARASRVVNVFVFERDRILGLNTDAHGFGVNLVECLGAAHVRSGPAAVIGAGGAARAVVLALSKLGVPEIRLANRTRARADKLARELQLASLRLLDWDDWRGLFTHASLAVNATTVGMLGGPSLKIPLENLPLEAAVADVVYNPLETQLLESARARGHRIVDGLGMLMHQGVPCFAAWFGVEPKVTPALRAALEGALRG